MSIECRTPFYNTLRSNEQSNPAPQPREVLECSGLPWVGPKDSGWTPKQWPELKADTKKCPFGQLPLLEARAPQCCAAERMPARTAGRWDPHCEVTLRKTKVVSLIQTDLDRQIKLIFDRFS